MYFKETYSTVYLFPDTGMITNFPKLESNFPKVNADVQEW